MNDPFCDTLDARMIAQKFTGELVSTGEEQMAI
jgi:hypothetical protein